MFVVGVVFLVPVDKTIVWKKSLQYLRFSQENLRPPEHEAKNISEHNGEALLDQG